METAKAKALLRSERARTEKLLSDMDAAGSGDRTAANQEGDMFDSAQPLTEEGTDDSVTAELQERLAAIDRAEARVEDGTYGYSVRSGQPIPDDRLEADPAAELTLEESQQADRPEPRV
jgi:DnaK suppressor protein